MRRAVILAGTAAALVALFVVLRRSGDEDVAAGPTTTIATTTTATTDGATTATTTPTTTTTTTTTTGPPAGPARVRITVRIANPPKPRKLTIRKGRRLILIVSADVADHVHLHGYDRFADVAPGEPARLDLRATIPGRFEVELEDRKLLIAELEVRP